MVNLCCSIFKKNKGEANPGQSSTTAQGSSLAHASPPTNAPPASKTGSPSKAPTANTSSPARTPSPAKTPSTAKTPSLAKTPSPANVPSPSKTPSLTKTPSAPKTSSTSRSSSLSRWETPAGSSSSAGNRPPSSKNSVAGKSSSSGNHSARSVDPVEPVRYGSWIAMAKAPQMPPCTQCPVITFKDIDGVVKHVPQDYCQKVFHLQCNDCQPAISSTAESLCQFCKHFRPGHFFRCLLPLFETWNHKSDNKYWNTMNLLLGSFDEVRSRASCSFCGSMAKAAAQQGWAGNDELYLWFFFLKPRDNWPDEASSGYLGEVMLCRRTDPSGPVAFQIRDMFQSVPGQGKDRQSIAPLQHFIPKPTLDEEVDYGPIQGWVSECNSSHSKTCNPTILDPLPLEFRLIDLTRNCLVRAAKGAPYVALSYVWGPDPRGTIESLRANIATLEKDGALLKQKLPRTVKDAIRATKALGYRYIWVDRLCIVQDDVDTVKKSQLDAMGHIYGCASLTIVALAGQDAHYGLPGVVATPSQASSGSKKGSGPNAPSKRRQKQVQFSAQGLEFTEARTSLTIHVRNTKWASRGWTFQEAVLSKRLLFFTDDGVVYECAHDHGYTRHEIGAPQSKSDDGPMFHSRYYTGSVSDFSTRDFTNEADTLKAFSGYAHYVFGKEHRAGLPFTEWDGAILWVSRNVDAPKRKPPPVTSAAFKDDDVFPSWSWSSVRGQIEYHNILPKLLTSVASWALCNKDTKSGKVSLQPIRSVPGNIAGAWNDGQETISQGRPRRGNYATVYCMLGAALAWNEGCFSPPATPATLPAPIAQALKTGSWWDVQAAVSKRWKDYGSFWDEVHGGASNPAYLQKFTQDDVREGLAPGRVLVATQSAVLDLHWIHELTSVDRYTRLEQPAGNLYMIKNKKGLELGFIKLGEELGGKAKGKAKTAQPVSMEFLALSLSEQWEGRAENPASANEPTFFQELARAKCAPGDEVFYRAANGEKLPWTEDINGLMLNVMMVERHGNVVRRLGIGQVVFKRWVKCGPVFKTHVLE